MISEAVAGPVLADLEGSSLTGRAFRKKVVDSLAQLDNYEWSGIYRLEDDELIVDEYVGETTDHTRIKVGVGVCGTAVAENRNQLIEDVRNIDNYLSCSLHTRSEIVVLIRVSARILGQIDIDGHIVGAFDESDEAFLSKVADIVGARWD